VGLGVTTASHVAAQVYNVSTSKNLPHWLSSKKKRGLRKDEEYRRRIELVQDLNFPSACTSIKASQDGEYLFAAGLHGPQVCRYPSRCVPAPSVTGQRKGKKSERELFT
jgi:ribosome biogenesis protein ENP2